MSDLSDQKPVHTKPLLPPPKSHSELSSKLESPVYTIVCDSMHLLSWT